MLKLVNLDDRVRRYMLDEFERDIRAGTLHVSDRLSNTGQQNYATLLKEAIRWHDERWLAEQLESHGRLRASESRRKPKGGYTTARVPATAARTIAEDEFNRYYVRGLCRLAEEEGIPELVVYRAKRVAHPRPESQRLVGSRLNTRSLLNDLRAHPGTQTALGVPPGPNSGLSVRLPEPADAAARTELSRPAELQRG